MDDHKLFETYKEDIYRYCLHMLRSQSDAEDICQEVFVKAMLADRIQVEYIKAWLMRIAANECHSLMRRRSNGNQKEKKAFSINLPLHPSPSVEQAYEQAETADEFGRLLDKLNPKPREALLLYYMADLSTNDTARTLNVRVGTAKSRINRGLGVLKKLYEKLPEAQRKGSGHRASSY
ncbi:RNA polymerase sigma factor [Saccharibacillus endophyticus]|uniref:RNA polymerase sigma factor SigX n=1 Tax=Saccharibacillus endophyticus TaxID=2060666 RepID=A0ABQ1ZS54_9BACL|nr:RNA polymerase sigma factor [Saccharibacillus endophyticus]GGH76357.1 RNA polymerase sigma factor SigX [Saccharibacillus endophyticus]